MIDERDVVQHAVDRLAPPEPSFERLLRRRERKNRNKRIATVVVAIAVLVVPVWLVSISGRAGRTIAPASTGPTTAHYPSNVGLVSLPPMGATPSTPERGRLMLDIVFGHTGGDGDRFTLSMYADGRVIWQRLGMTRGLIEQRLTPQGVDLVLGDVLSTGLFEQDHRWFVGGSDLYYGGVSVRSGARFVELAWGDTGSGLGIDAPKTTPTPEQVLRLEELDARLEDLTSELPASAWEDPEYRAYVPAGYGVCYVYNGPNPPGRLGVLDLLPAPVGDLLSPLEPTQSHATFWCSDVSTEQARELVAAMRDAGFVSHQLSFSDPPVDVELEPALPEE